MEYQSLKLHLSCIIWSDISLSCLGIVVSFIYRRLTKETIFFQYPNLEYMTPKSSEKCSLKFYHKFVLLMIYILKNS